jgi:hypothetical protein
VVGFSTGSKRGSTREERKPVTRNDGDYDDDDDNSNNNFYMFKRVQTESTFSYYDCNHHSSNTASI